MVRRLSSIYRQIPKPFQGTVSRIQNRNLSGDQISGMSEELMQNPQTPVDVLGKNQLASLFPQIPILSGNQISVKSEALMRNPQTPVGEKQIFSIKKVAKEVSCIIRTRPKWEETLLSDFPTVNFVEPDVYNEILEQQNNVFHRIRFYLWLKGLKGSSLDPALCSMIHRKLVKAGAAKMFEQELQDLELFIVCLCEQGLLDESLYVFERLKRASYTPSLQTWKHALFHSVRIKRGDVVWRLYRDMMEYGFVLDTDTFGYLIQACCLQNDSAKGYEFLQHVLQAGCVPHKEVFDMLISSLCKSREYGKMSGVLHNMIAKGCSPDIYTYTLIINGLSGGRMQHEQLRIFNDLKARGYSPGIDMYTTIIQSLCKDGDLVGARKLWFEMDQRGILPNEHTYSAIIGALCKNGCIDEAEKLFKEMIEKEHLWKKGIHRLVIAGLWVHGHVKEAEKLFKLVKLRDWAPAAQMKEETISQEVVGEENGLSALVMEVGL